MFAAFTKFNTSYTPTHSADFFFFYHYYLIEVDALIAFVIHLRGFFTKIQVKNVT